MTDSLLDELAARDGIGVTVLGPGMCWSSSREATGSFRIASVTKTFVAAAFMLLHEEGLDLAAAAVPLVDPLLAIRLTRAGLDPTLLQLLAHTSGLPDHSSDPAYVSAVLADPRHRWTPCEQLDIALAQPLADGFCYSDTGYVLLGSALEQLTGQSLPAAVRRLVLEPLGLRQTWWEEGDVVPSAPPARIRQLAGAVDVSTIDPSVDLYGGGGLISTTEDLATFAQALLSGRLLGSSLEVMKRPGVGSPQGLGLCELEPGLWGHTGFWGTAMAAAEDGSWSVGVVVTQAPAYGGADPTPLPGRFLRASGWSSEYLRPRAP